MKRKMWNPDIIIGVILVAGCLGLLFAGINSEVKTILGMAALWLFGRTAGVIKPRIYRVKRKGKHGN